MTWQKRKMMMMQAQPTPPPSHDIVPDSWTIPGGLNATGSETAAGYSARSAYITCTPGATIKRTGEGSYDGKNINMHIHQYANGVWKRRTSASLAVGSVETLGSDCNSIKITFAFGSSSGMAMTQAIVAQCYGAEWV